MPRKSSDSAARTARLRLHLRAERAMGLGSLPVKRSGTTRPKRSDLKQSGQTDGSVQSSRRAIVDSMRESPVAPRAVPQSHPAAAGRAMRAKSPLAEPSPAPHVSGGGGAPGVEDLGPFSDSPPVREEKIRLLTLLDTQHVKGCTRCRLSEGRTHTVFGEGDPDARLLFIGEAPGEQEDLQGRPFVGRSGHLLDKMIAAMGLSREDVFIANVVKCRPPDNREPLADEVAACSGYLIQQIEWIRPHVIVTLGKSAAQLMLRSKLSLSKMRGRWHDWRGIRLMPTYHPSYVLRNYTAETRRTVWEDLRLAMDALGIQPEAGGGLPT